MVGVDIYRVVVVDVDMAEAVHVIGMWVHDQAVTIQQGLFLSDSDMADEGLEGMRCVSLVKVIGVIIEDLDDLNRVAARGAEFHMAHLRMGVYAGEQAGQEYGYGDA